jgi:hypothetical protein
MMLLRDEWKKVLRGGREELAVGSWQGRRIVLSCEC